MSIWGDIRMKADGKTINKEEFNLVYPGKLEKSRIAGSETIATRLDVETYKECEISVWTTGKYPEVKIEIDRPLSAFAGAGMVQVENEDGQKFNLERTSNGTVSTYTYAFNKDEDYVLGEHPGKQYSVQTLMLIGRGITDLILKSEDNLASRMGND